MLTGLIPLGDDNEDRLSTTYVTYGLIALNVFVFVFLQGLGANDRFTYGYAAIPAEIIRGRDLIDPVLIRGVPFPIPQAPGPTPIFLTVFSAMFMHGGFMHLIGNMLYLWIFGDNVEDALGHGKFLAFYLICGILATFAHIAFNLGSVIPSLGASGAIAGVLGGYLRLYPSRNVRVLVVFLFVTVVHLPAIVVIGIWAVMQFLNGIGSVALTAQTTNSGVAYMAHVGGFTAGLALVSLFRNPETAGRVEKRVTLPPGRSYYQ